MRPGEEGYDSFESMTKLSEVSESQDEKLRNCPFARESEAFPDSNSDWLTSSSQGWSSPEPIEGIIMVSPPDSGGSFDHNTPREDDNYHTPPEHYYSFASDSDDAKQPPPPPPGTTACGGDDDQPMDVDMGEEEEGNLGVQGFDGNLSGKPTPLPPPATTLCGGDVDQVVENDVHSGDEVENLGHQLGLKIEGDGDLRGKQLPCQLPPPPATPKCDRDNDDETMRAVEEENLGFLASQLDRTRDDMEVLPCELDRDSAFEGEFRENAAKNITVCEGDTGLGIDTVCVEETLENFDTDIIDVDSEKYDGELVVGEQRVCINLVPLEKEWSEGNSVREGVNLFKNEENCGGNSKGENLFRDGEEGGRDGEGENLFKLKNDLICGDISRNEILLNGGGRDGKDENLGNNCEGNIEIRKGKKLCKIGESRKGGHLSENRRESDSISRGKRLQSNDEEGGDSSKRENGDSVGCAAKNLESTREKALRKALETIEKFKCVGSSGSMEPRGKKKSVLGKSELPLPIIGKKNGAQKVEDENDGVKGGSLKDLLDTLKLVMAKPNDGSEHDFLETAKRRGVVFPRPRWWPPEGSDDDYSMA